MEDVFEGSVFLATHDSYLGTLSGLKSKFLIERAADIAFQMVMLLLRLRKVLNYW